MGRRRHRVDVELRRKQAADDVQARQAQAAQQLAQLRRDWRHRQQRKGLAIGLMILGGLVIVAHWVAHAGAFGLGATGLEDLVAGYPAGAVLILIGAIAYGRD